LNRSEVRNFVRFYMENAEDLVEEVGYTPLAPSIYQQNLATLEQQT
jgi:phosphate transport system substrate-binding protein